jgi:hypothetical protein
VNPSDEDQEGAPRPFGDAAAAKSLRLLLASASLGGSTTANSAVVHLQQRLEQADGAAWLAGCLAKPPFAPLADPRGALVDGTAPLAELEALKERAKAGFAEARPREERLASAAAYFLAIAAAAKHHRRALSSIPTDTLKVLLIELAASAPEPWSSLLSAAAFVELPR